MTVARYLTLTNPIDSMTVKSSVIYRRSPPNSVKNRQNIFMTFLSITVCVKLYLLEMMMCKRERERENVYVGRCYGLELGLGLSVITYIEV